MELITHLKQLKGLEMLDVELSITFTNLNTVFSTFTNMKALHLISFGDTIHLDLKSFACKENTDLLTNWYFVLPIVGATEIEDYSRVNTLVKKRDEIKLQAKKHTKQKIPVISPTDQPIEENLKKKNIVIEVCLLRPSLVVCVFVFLCLCFCAFVIL